MTQETIPRKYFSGGANLSFAMNTTSLELPSVKVIDDPNTIPVQANGKDMEDITAGLDLPKAASPKLSLGNVAMIPQQVNRPTLTTVEMFGLESLGSQLFGERESPKYWPGTRSTLLLLKKLKEF